jgi:hypothetical protein
MSKYAPLTEFLRSRPQSELPCSFADVEKALGFPLPPVARTHRAWWSNNGSNNVMTRAWLKAGFKAEQVDMRGETLVFRRVEGAARPAPAKTGEERLDDAALIGRIMDVLRGDQVEADALRRAILAALPAAKAKSALDVFSSDLPDEAFEGVFTQDRQSGWRGVDL